METKSVLQSKRSWFNYGSAIALGITALLADEAFSAMISDTLGIKGVVGMMIAGAIVNQYLAQTSTKRPTFQMPKKKPKARSEPSSAKSNLDILDEPSEADDDFRVNS